MTPQPIETAPKDGSWVLAYVPKLAAEPYNQPWLVLTWNDNGWVDREDDAMAPSRWVPLPDPQPKPTGWTQATGTIRVQEITGEGWTKNGQPISVPYRWSVYIERADGAYDEYRETFHQATLEAAEATALRWQSKYGLPIVRVPLSGKVVPFRPALTRQ